MKRTELRSKRASLRSAQSTKRNMRSRRLLRLLPQRLRQVLRLGRTSRLQHAVMARKKMNARSDWLRWRGVCSSRLLPLCLMLSKWLR